MKFLVSLGVPAKNYEQKLDGFRYNGAILQVIDWNRKKVLRQADYVSPKENLGISLSMMFKGAQVVGDQMYVVTNTEILQYCFNDFHLCRVLTNPSFSDLHAVLVNDKGVYVCNTGLEVVQRFDTEGQLVDEWNIAFTPTWKRFDRDIDYRRIASTKPHDVHINHLFELDGEVWVNMGSQRSARSLTDPTNNIVMDASFGDEEKVLCHDGLVQGDSIYFTSVNGSIVVVDRESHLVSKRIDINSRNDGENKIGWTRGIEVVGQKAYVGVTKMRHSKFKEYTRWMLTGRHGFMPSAILEVDLYTHNVTGTYEMNGFQGCAIYSIIKVD